MIKKAGNKKNVKKFPLSRLAKNWPFSTDLVVAIFARNQTGYFSSLKEFLIYTWLEQERRLSDTSNVNSDSESSSDSDDNLSNEKVDSWPQLKYPGFFIEKNEIFFKESINQKTSIYSLKEIKYETIICEAIRFYTKDFLEDIEEIEDVGYRERSRQFKLWCLIFRYMLFTKYSTSIKELLIEEKYFPIYQKEMIFAFYYLFKIVKDSYVDSDRLSSIKEESLRERLENLFVFSNLSKSESKKLIDNVLSTKSVNSILSYYLFGKLLG